MKRFAQIHLSRSLSLYLLILIVTVAFPTVQVRAFTDPGNQPADTLVQKKLATYQTWKFGLLMHWGPYSQWGVVESWSICPEDEDWCRREGPYGSDYYEYKRHYENLPATFNPTAFDPSVWADAARDAGMKYVVFTTKHHDGFCMFDTKQTDYKVTGPECAFHDNPKNNIAKEVFSAFRAKGFGIGAYFSKPDWHSPDYWSPKFPPVDRNVNYDIKKYPAKWEAFKKFTYNQIEELMTAYGPVDILWLDGGWVQPMTPTSPRWGRFPVDQNIDMPAIAAMARSHQPGLIVVDRAVEGPYQNYRTPEQEVPEKPLPYVWETCMTMGDSWSYVPNDKYKPTSKLIHLLVDIVAKGGNFLLNIGPGPDGRLPDTAMSRLASIGAWMRVNSSAIYDTHPLAPYKEGATCFTQDLDGGINAIVLADSTNALPSEIVLHAITPARGSKVHMLGVEQPLEWREDATGVRVNIPASLQKNPPCSYAWTLHFTKGQQ